MPTVSVNTHFPGYEILGELGRSNARVLKARHVATGDLVAIKHFTLGTDADTLRRFQQESAIMTSIRHPNVVQVREVQLNRPMPYIVMEWVEGGDLRSILTRQGPLDVPTLIRLGLQMAGAFSAIHPQGIIHRDIKPENILYRPLPSGELHFLLTDFGIARLREQSQTMTGQSLMTYEYASPEQFDNPRGVTPAADYYALGVVLYECLAGRVPFSLTDTGSIALFMDQVLQVPPPIMALQPDQYLPPSLQTLLTWTLAKDPAQRLNDVTELTLLLSQANVERLQPSRPESRSAIAPSRLSTRAAPLSEIPIAGSSAPDYADEPGSNSTWWGILTGLLVVGLMIGAVVYYKQHQPASATQVVPDSVMTMPDSSAPDEMATDTMAIPSEPPGEVITIDSATIAPAPVPGISTTTVSDSAGVVRDSSDTDQ